MQALAAGAVAIAALAIAANCGVKGFSAVPEVVRGSAGLLVLVSAAGYAPARLLVPRAMWPNMAVLVPLVGCAVAGVALSMLGFVRVPIEASVAVVLIAGVAAAVVVRRRLGPARPSAEALQAEGGRRFTLAWPGYLALVLACILLIPILQAGYATVPGTNPDAMLAVGTAELLQHTAPGEVENSLPVDEMPPVWRSKYPVYYVLAGASTLSGLDPVESFAAVAAMLAVLAAAGFMLLARHGLRASPPAAVAVMGTVGLCSTVGYLAVHPYFNQLVGLLTLGPMLLFGLRFIDSPDRRDGALLGLFAVLGLAAYPLMALFPAVILTGAAVTARRSGELPLPARPRLPRGRGARAALIVAGVVAAPAAVLIAAGILEKAVSAAGLLLTGESLAEWRGDLDFYFAPGFFVGVPGPLGYVLAAAVLIAAVASLRKLPRPVATGLAAVFAIAIAVAVMFRAREFGEYFYFKVLAFLGPLLLTAAVVWLASLTGRGRTAAMAVGATATVFLAFQFVGIRDEVAEAGRQADRPVLELRAAARELPPGASIRIDVPPGGAHLWAAYALSEHPLTTTWPLLGTTYPSVPAGRRADYLVRDRREPLSRDAERPPVFRNSRFEIYRMRPGVPGPDRSSRRMVPAEIGPGA